MLHAAFIVIVFCMTYTSTVVHLNVGALGGFESWDTLVKGNITWGIPKPPSKHWVNHVNNMICNTNH